MAEYRERARKRLRKVSFCLPPSVKVFNPSTGESSSRTMPHDSSSDLSSMDISDSDFESDDNEQVFLNQLIITLPHLDIEKIQYLKPQENKPKSKNRPKVTKAAFKYERVNVPGSSKTVIKLTKINNEPIIYSTFGTSRSSQQIMEESSEASESDSSEEFSIEESPRAKSDNQPRRESPAIKIPSQAQSTPKRKPGPWSKTKGKLTPGLGNPSAPSASSESASANRIDSTPTKPAPLGPVPVVASRDQPSTPSGIQRPISSSTSPVPKSSVVKITSSSTLETTRPSSTSMELKSTEVTEDDILRLNYACYVCKVSYTRVKTTVACLKKHGLQPCFLCNEPCKLSAESYRKHCLAKGHLTPTGEVQCPVFKCQKVMKISCIKTHIFKGHLEPCELKRKSESERTNEECFQAASLAGEEFVTHGELSLLSV